MQDRCCEVMLGHRKNDIWAVLDFMCRFTLPRMQGSCLHFLSQLSRGRLVDHAERIVKVGCYNSAEIARLAYGRNCSQQWRPAGWSED